MNILDYYFLGIITMAGLNVFQFIFWARQNARLVDKVMSRNYAEYKQVEHLAPLPNRKPDSNQKEQENIDQAILDELNGLMGAI